MFELHVHVSDLMLETLLVLIRDEASETRKYSFWTAIIGFCRECGSPGKKIANGFKTEVDNDPQKHFGKSVRASVEKTCLPLDMDHECKPKSISLCVLEANLPSNFYHCGIHIFYNNKLFLISNL